MSTTRQPDELNGRTYIVTGASSGIGRAVVERLLAGGARVVGLARDCSKLPVQDGGRVETHDVDLADLDALPAFLDALVGRHADLDGAVLAAGSGRFKGLEQFSAAEVREAIDLNLTSHVLVARALLPALKRSRRGDIVLIGSESALRGRRRGTLYCAAKFGLRGFAQALREECAAAGIRVTLINPGSVRTGFFRELDFAPGDDDANAILPGEVADVIAHVLGARHGVVFDEIDLTPLKRVVRLRSGRETGPDAP